MSVTLEWKSTPEFGPVNKINLYLGTVKGETDITNQIYFPLRRKRRPKKGYEFEGSIQQIFSNWETMPVIFAWKQARA